MNVVHRLLKCTGNYRGDVDFSVVCLSLGNANLREGVTRALFHDEGQILNLRDMFQIFAD